LIAWLGVAIVALVAGTKVPAYEDSPYVGPNFSSGKTAYVGPNFSSGDQQTRDNAPVAQAAAGTASISGVVTTAEMAARPVGLAHVVAIGAFTGTVKITSTDRDGRFSFSTLPADRYVVGASKAPYLGAVAGARRPGRPGSPIVVADGEKLANVAIRLPLGASISGTIIDERGQPAVNTPVMARQRRMQNGEPMLVAPPGATSNASTDERGRYRLYGLPPGEYVVSATRAAFPITARQLSDAEVDRGLQGSAPPAPAVETMAAVPSFFPGTTRQAEATPVAVAVGEDRQGVDFRVELARTARVGGTVTTSEGLPAEGTVVMLSSAPSSPLQQTSVASVTRDGRFQMAAIAPGSYTVTSRRTLQGSPGTQFAVATIEVAGVDQPDIPLVLRPAMTLTGRLAFDGASPAPALGGQRIPFRSLTPAVASFATPQVTPTSPTGAFSIAGVTPGRFVIGGPLTFGATTASVTWALESVLADGRDITDLAIDITAESLPKEVIVTFSDRPQALAGRLQTAAGSPASDYTVILFPADKNYWLHGSRRILTARPATDGRFQFGGPGPASVPAGAYLLAAVTDIDRDEQFDPALLESLRSAAVSVTIGAGEKKTQDLVIR
jgi:5-hydroxyisourate hydrolase-like protein (transthyretin family)